MYLDELPAILRAAGLTVEVCNDFGGNRHGPMSSIGSIMCHHTAGPKTGDRPSLNVVRYGRPGLDGPLAQLFLSRSGVWVCVSNGLAWHAGVVSQARYGNSHSIGIEAEATGVDAWPPTQYDSYARGAQALAVHFSAVIIAHKEACSPPGRKPDPNFDMNAFRSYAAGSPGAPPAAVVIPADFPDDEENQMLILFDTVATDSGDTVHNFHGQRTAEAGGGSNIAKSAWACFSTAWGGCNVSIAALTGTGKLTWIFGATGKPGYVKNNTSVALSLPEGTRLVTVEGTRDSPGTVPACDIYNLR